MLRTPPPRKKLFDPKELKDLGEHLALVTNLGLTMVAAVGIGLAIGYYLDRWTGHRGLWKAVFLPIGVLSGLWAGYRIIVDLQRRSEDRHR